jgi:hypothetical protein
MRLAAFALAVVFLTLGPHAHAAPPAIAVDEINYLLGFIGGSGCKFYRNGSWYDSHRAQSHLRDKYNYLAARDRIKTAEDFIEEAATRSSMSGIEYQIQCEAGPAVPSNRWLRTALIDYRSSLRQRATLKSPLAALRARTALGILIARSLTGRQMIKELSGKSRNCLRAAAVSPG